MKKRIACVCLGLIAAVSLMTACGQGNNTQPPDPTLDPNTAGHTHSFSVWATVAEPTCTQEGEKSRTCFCGEQQTRKIKPLPHSFGEWLMIKEPTCTNTGEQKRICNCGAEETMELKPLPHSVDEWTIVKDATCTEDGSRTQMCSICEEHWTETIPAMGHSPSEWVGTKATCTEDGLRYQYCLICNMELNIEMTAATGHALGEWTKADATCTENGSHYQPCIACNEHFNVEEIPKLGHDYSNEWVVDKDATCAEAGSKSRHCSQCDDTTDVMEIPAIGHNYDATLPAKLCEGQNVNYVCKRCNDNYTEKLMAISANVILSYRNYWGSTTLIQDVVTISEIKGGYGKYTITITYINPKGESRSYQYSDIDTSIKNDIYLEDAGWSLTDRAQTPPFVKIEISDELGFTTTYEGTCPTLKQSDYIYGRNNYPDGVFAFDVFAMGHIDAQWTVYKAATCTYSGQNRLVCNTCKKVLKTETIAAKHHYSVSETYPTCEVKGATTISCSKCTSTRSKEWAPITIEITRVNYSLDQANGPIHFSALVVKNITGGCVIYDELGNIADNQYTVMIFNVDTQEYKEIQNISEKTGSASGSFVDATKGNANATYQVVVNDGRNSYVFYVWPEADRMTLVGISSEHHDWNNDVCGKETVCRLCAATQYVPHAALSGKCPKCEKTVVMPKVLLPTPVDMPNGGALKVAACAVGAYAENDTFVVLSITLECPKSNTTFAPVFICEVMAQDGWVAGIIVCDMGSAEVVGRTYRRTFTIATVTSPQYSLSIQSIE